MSRRAFAAICLAGSTLAWPAIAADVATGTSTSAKADAAGHLVLAERLASLPIGPPLHRPMTIESGVEGHVVRGTIVGLIDRPLADVRGALRSAEHWCSVLILHVNNQACSVKPSAAGPRLSLRVARKPDQPVDKAYELAFLFRVERATADVYSVRLESAEGPLGTSDYRIGFDASPAGDARTMVTLTYAYRQSTMTAWAMSAYLATVGGGKVGFSPASEGSGKPVAGVRGIAERNLMRYFLAIQAASRTPRAADEASYRSRLQDWFEATEQYPAQLRELSREDYLALKAPLLSVGVVADAARP